MRLFLTGDTHGGLSVGKLSEKNWPEQNNLNREDLLIILGDFGFIWSDEPNNAERYWMELFNERNYRVAFVDGNHENHPRLSEMPEVSFHGGIAGQVSENIWHLKRGEIYRIGNKDIFVMGGADSIDKFARKPGISWWKDEIPSPEEMEHALNNLEKYDYNVDYILTHTLPKKVVSSFMRWFEKTYDPAAIFLDIVNDHCSYEKWFGAHFHEDFEYGKFQVLYQQIIEVEVNLTKNV